MSYNVRNPVIESILKELGVMIGKALPKGWGFTLLIFSLGEKGSLFYISNAERESMIEAMKEFIKRNEQ